MDGLIRLSVNIDAFKYPDGTEAVSCVSFDVGKGEFIGALGVNGSGKTTLLKIIDGLMKEYTGAVRLDGKDIRKLSPKEIYSKVGLVFQNPDDQLFAPTVFEEVAFGPANMGVSEEEIARRVKKALKDVEMEEAAGRPIRNLSYGQKKRVCIASLLAMGHEILLLDEPTSGLDPMGVNSIMHLLKNLNDKGVTIIMSTHSVDLVPLFITRVIVLKSGNLVMDGLPEDIFSNPEKIRESGLRMPRIGHLFEILKNRDSFDFDKLPLTIGQARTELKRCFKKAAE